MDPIDSPFHDLLGFTLDDWREGFARVSCAVQPGHMNRNGILHGGLLLTLMDEVGGLCGVWTEPGRDRRRSVTVNLSGSFTGRVEGGQVVATGRLVSHGRSLFYSRSEIHRVDGTLVAFSSSTHRWRSGSGPVASPSQSLSKSVA